MKTNSLKTRAQRGEDLFKAKPKKKQVAEKEAAPAVQIGAHGRYQIKSGRLAGEYVARAFPKPPARTRGLIAEATGATEEAAVAALHEALDARETSRRGERRTDPHTGTTVPSAMEYVEALRQVDLSKPQRALLDALSLAKDDGLTEVGMARAAGYKSRASVRKSFAGAGLLIADFLSIETINGKAPDDIEGIALVGYRGTPVSEEHHGNWILHEELREALFAERA